MEILLLMLAFVGIVTIFKWFKRQAKGGLVAAQASEWLKTVAAYPSDFRSLEYRKEFQHCKSGEEVKTLAKFLIEFERRMAIENEKHDKVREQEIREIERDFLLAWR